MTTKNTKDHLVVDNKHHRAVKSVAADEGLDMKELLVQILDKDPRIRRALERAK